MKPVLKISKKKYKYLLMIILVIWIVLINVIMCFIEKLASGFDAYGFYGSNGIFYYFFNISPTIEWISFSLILLVFMLIVNQIYKLFSKKHYDFFVALECKNIVYERIVMGIVLAIVIIISGFAISLSNIDSVTVYDDKWVLSENELFQRKKTENGFEILEEAQVYKGFGDLRFYGREPGKEHRFFIILNAGKNNKYSDELVNVFSKKTNLKISEILM